MRRCAVPVIVTLLLLAVAAPALAGGGGGADWTCRAFGEGDTIAMHDSCFDGIGHVVDVGTTITVVNEGALPHTFTAVDRSFDTGTLAPGESARLTVDEPGAHPVYCTLHASLDGRGMAGLLVVGDTTNLAAEPATQPAAAERARDDVSATGWGVWILALMTAPVLVAVIIVVRARQTAHRR